MVLNLSRQWFGPSKAPRTAVFLHGIFGQKRNWRTPAHNFRQLHPQFSCMTVDLRGHGESPKFAESPEAKNTLSACADDVKTLISEEHTNVDLLVAHSFGGKVALKYLERLEDDVKSGIHKRHRFPRHTWILDSIPRKYAINRVGSSGPSMEESTQSVVRVLKALKSFPESFESPQWAVDKLVEIYKIELSVAQWLATNIVSQETHGQKTYKFNFNMSMLHEMFQDFIETDMWPFLESYGANHEGTEEFGHIHFVQAGRNPLWTEEIKDDFKALIRKNNKIHLHLMPNVGHWLHTEDLPGLLNIISVNSGLHNL